MAGTNGTTLETGEIASQQIRVGIVVLSYFVSVLGSLTTLELLNRRTAGRGGLNWFLLGASSVSMGAIAMWSMHFIGNQAIILDHGNPDHQLMYSPAFTAVSFFTPIIVLSVAFFFAGANEEKEVSKIQVGLGGALAGIAICAMHYAGQFGVANYTSVYRIAHVVGSVVIAVAASVSALVIFFILRSRWEGSFPKRLVCSFVLAAAVSGMHWVAATGTSYRLRSSNTINHVLSRNQIIIMVLVFSVAACAFLIAFAIYIGTKNRKLNQNSENIVLSSVIFDNDGRLLVTTDGFIPSETILDCDQAKVFAAFEDEFSRVHPVFQWLYRTSRYWEAVKEQIEVMQQHITATKSLKRNTDIGLLFREMFCVAAHNLSQRLRLPLEEFGVLYEDLITTGVGATTGLTNAPATLTKASRFQKKTGKGHTLIVCRKVNKQQTLNLQANGFRFGPVNLVLDAAAKPLQVSSDQLRVHLDTIQRQLSKDDEAILEPGVHIGCFATQKHTNGATSIVVLNEARDLIPSFPMPIASLPRKHARYLAKMEGLTVTEIIQKLRNESFLHDRNKETPTKDHEEQAFMVHFQMSLQGMIQKYKDRFILDARLVRATFEIPCRHIQTSFSSRRGSEATPSTPLFDEKVEALQQKADLASMIIFRVELPSSSRGYMTSNFKLEPLRFFYTRQRCFSTSPDHHFLARRSQEEFGEVLEAAISRDGMGGFSIGNMLSSRKMGVQRLSGRRPGSGGTSNSNGQGATDTYGSIGDSELGMLRGESTTWAQRVMSLTLQGKM